jgi:hypothetical protein
MLQRHGKIGAGLWKGLKLLATGRFREFFRNAGTNLEAPPRPSGHDVGGCPVPVPFGDPIAGNPRVTIIIPSACVPLPLATGHAFLVVRCTASIRRLTRYSNYEIILMHNRDLPGEFLAALEDLGVIAIRYSGPFNWSRVNNLAARRATGDHLLFLNDDTEVMNESWLDAMLKFSQQANVGAVGAALLFPDGRWQHAGIVLRDGLPVHDNYLQRVGPDLPTECDAVTGACLMTRAEVFRRMGGFNEAFPLHYNDVDYCLRLWKSGLRTICTPQARLQHIESATLGDAPMTETDLFQELWSGTNATLPV